VGVVFQDYALFPHLDVLHNVLYGIKRRFPSLPAPRQIARAREYLDLVRLSGWDKRSVESLSGGEKQRVALARALAPEPELLLLDEPLSALDAGLRVSLRREIARIQAETSLLALYVTHDQEEALSLSDELFLMNRGRILQGGRPEEVYRRPGSLFAASFLGGANFITGRLDQGEGTFLTDAGRRLGVCPSPGFVSGPGRLFFRPEDGRFCGLPENPEAGDFNYFKARLVKTEFLGAFRLFHLLTEEGPVILQAPAGEALPEGELWFKVPRLCCLGFSGQD
jgi:ABC-type Fe3+/spermidine/putrescine transport system ATPase subunit